MYEAIQSKIIDAIQATAQALIPTKIQSKIEFMTYFQIYNLLSVAG